MTKRYTPASDEPVNLLSPGSLKFLLVLQHLLNSGLTVVVDQAVYTPDATKVLPYAGKISVGNSATCVGTLWGDQYTKKDLQRIRVMRPLTNAELAEIIKEATAT